MRERSNHLSQAIVLSLRPAAPLRLGRLLTSHRLAAPYTEWHHGIGMYRDLFSLKNNVGLREDAQVHDEEVQQALKTSLPDGCSSQDCSDKVNDLQMNHLPYLVRPFPSDAARLIVRTTPRANAAEGRALLTRLEASFNLTSEF